MISPLGVRDGRNRHRDVDASAILADADRFVVINTLGGANLSQNVVLVLVEFRRHDQTDRLPNRFGRGVAEDPLGSAIPRGNGALEILADDGVVGRRDDARKAELGDILAV